MEFRKYWTTTTLDILNPSATHSLKLYSQTKRSNSDEVPEFVDRWEDERCIGIVSSPIPSRLNLSPGERIVLEASTDSTQIRFSTGFQAIRVNGNSVPANTTTSLIARAKERVSLSTDSETAVTVHNLSVSGVKIIQQHIVRSAAPRGQETWSDPVEDGVIGIGLNREITLQDRVRVVIETASPTDVGLIFSVPGPRDVRLSVLVEGKIERGEILHPSSNGVISISRKRAAVLEQLLT